MGCGSSQAVEVISQNRPVERKVHCKKPLVVKEFQEGLESIESVSIDKEEKIQEKKCLEKFEERPALEARNSGFMSLIPLNAGPNYQGTPFDSGKSSKVDFELDKVSDQSSLFSNTDSGYLDSPYRNVITEKSEMNAIRKVEQEFKENLNLRKLI